MQQSVKKENFFIKITSENGIDRRIGISAPSTSREKKSIVGFPIASIIEKNG